MIRLLSLIAPAVFGLSGCSVHESIERFTSSEAEYVLVSMDGLAFNARATIAFPEPGRVVGQAPCNRYFATQTVPYPWFGLEGIGSTRMACSDMAFESAFFAALEDVTIAQVSGDTLILSNTANRELVFVAR